MSEIDVSKCELVDCWFYIDHTPPKGQGDWCGAIHKGACKLNSTDCKDTPIERCLIKSLYEQLQQSKAENKGLKDTIKEMEDDLDDWISDVSILYTYDDGNPNNLDELHCCMEHGHEEWSKYKQCLDEIERLTKMHIQECIDNDDCYRAREQMKIILQLVQRVKECE